MKFYKKKTELEGITIGDFEAFDASSLRTELIAAIGEQGDPQRWYLNTSENEIDIVILDPDIDEGAVKDTVLAHGARGKEYYGDMAAQRQAAAGKTAIDFSDLQAATTIAQVKTAVIDILQKMI